jgi:hypothetical protein
MFRNLLFLFLRLVLGHESRVKVSKKSKLSLEVLRCDAWHSRPDVSPKHVTVSDSEIISLQL